MATVRLRRGREFSVGNYRIRLDDCCPREGVLDVEREDGLPLTDGEISYRPKLLPPKMDRYRPPLD